MNALTFKAEALNRFTNYLPDVPPIMLNADIDQVKQVYKVATGEIYIISEDTKAKYKNSFHVWLMTKTGFLLRSDIGVLGYETFKQADIDLKRLIRLKKQVLC